MGVCPEVLTKRFPRLYHMAEVGSWPGIQRHGLLSTSALLDLFEVKGAKREALEAQHRPECATITHPLHGSAVIRDQKPMSDSALNKVLQDGLTPALWYRTLNERVFFWLRRERLEGLLKARAYRTRRQTVLVVDTAGLLARHAERVALSPLNSGSTLFKPLPRGNDTFRPLSSYPFDEWDRKRKGRDPVVELTIHYAVPDIRDHVIRVEEVGGEQSPTLIWETSPSR